MYLANLRDQTMPPVQVLLLNEVLQVDVLESQQMLIVLSGMRSCASASGPR